MNLKSLSVRTLWKMALRITVVVLIVTVCGYLHLKHTIEEQSKNTLSSYNAEREARERIVFDEAQQNHEILKKEFLLQYKKNLKDPLTPGRYSKLVKRYDDGATRNRDEKFDGKNLSGIFIGPQADQSLSFMARTLAAYDLCNRMGPAYHSRFQDTYFTFPENAIVLYWPEQPLWALDAKNTLNMPEEEYASVSMPAQDPQKKTAWTGLFYDKVSKIWMVTGSTPIYDGAEFLGSVHHDVMVTELINRTLNDHLKGGRNYVVRADGRLIAHPTHLEELQKHDGKYDIKSSKDEVLLSQFQLLGNHSSAEVISDEHDNYLAIAKIAGPDWYLVSEYPKSIVRKTALENVGFLLGAGVFSLVVELIVLFFVLRREISRPLMDLISSAKEVAQGNYSIHLYTFAQREDELGQLAQSFTEMTHALNERDKMLARHNEDLESLVTERTRELDYQKTLNIQASRLSALGEMAGGMAHEINTPLATIKLLSAQATGEVRGDIPDMLVLEHALMQIDKTVDHVAKIIRGLKSFARNGNQDPFELTDLHSVIEDTVSLCTERCKLHGVQLRVVTLDHPVMVQGRSVQLCQVLLNLINNAHDAIEGLPDKWIEVRLVETPEGAELRVTDSGPGIPPELREKIFNPFFTTKGVGKGTGMGLSISHGIVQSHNGDIVIDEDSPHTCFKIRLPQVTQAKVA
ncbi:sensor histidine kinase [Bdellovibrio sp. HCB-162]|uniref:sensor histidine kinase n=1 Tax=Bdellovibrio sp. HCB-162 TaxID=3394234 RepID=UPI0039BD79EA